MKTKCIMVQGTMSDAGKSVVCAALCRIFKQDGYSVAPFKSQNMALNSYITRDGFEMGRAQVMQAEAAGIEPDVRMNPVLLKPSSDTGSQVIVLGEIRDEMSAMEYHHYKQKLLPEVRKAFDELAADHDIIVIEGAGSPAEINLAENDIVNMGLARYLNAPVLLVGDIDRGGVFAQLFGTAELMEKEDRNRIEGMIINKFRGDVEILKPGLDMLEDKTGIPVLGVIPMLHVDLDDEDSLSSRLSRKGGVAPIDIAVIRLPRLSNFTDFNALEMEGLSDVRYVREVKELGKPDLIILPGTKNTMADLCATYEYNFWPYGTGRDYRGAKRLTPFVFGGLGATFAKTDDKNVFTANVPIGIGVKYKLADRMNLGVEWCVHFSLSDKLDGMADPYGITSSGAFKNTDCYSALQVTLTYSFMAKCRTCHNEDE